MIGRITFEVLQSDLSEMMPEGCRLLDVVRNVESGMVYFICDDSRPGAQKWWHGMDPFHKGATMKGTLDEKPE